ncbi:MAG: alpha/beta hydrolase [Ruminococcaceae bacterium]|nr:alpha/beta hydrolase [Oscillospiraceae bacterium]
MLDFLDKFDGVQIIDERNYFTLMTEKAEPYLASKRAEGSIFSADGLTLHYEQYDKKLSRGTVVILHGFTESAEKFREVAYYFRKAGYTVFSFDLRGHGKSEHRSGKKERVETDSFDLYREDLEAFMNGVVIPCTGDRKIYFYTHSLGSTVALLYMMKNPYAVHKAVLSSPMICGNMGMPVAVAGTVAKIICLFGGKSISAPGRCIFDENQTAETGDASSSARFDYYHSKRKREPLYQTSGPSFGWVRASLEARDKILSSQSIKLLKTKMLIFKPEEDKQLLGEYTDKFASMARVKVKKVENSRHEIFMSGDETLKWYFGEILEFFRD